MVNYSRNEPIIHQGFLEKQRKKVIVTWQQRYFILQNSTLFYFKKKTDEDPVGSIPLVDINVSGGPYEKKPYVLRIVTGRSNKPNKSEYILSAGSEAEMKGWTDAIEKNRAYSIVERPLISALNIRGQHTLLPYFLQSALDFLNTAGAGTYNLWCKEIDIEKLANGLELLDHNLPLRNDDVYFVSSVILEYLYRLPRTLLSPDALKAFVNETTPEDIYRAIIMEPHPHRQLLMTMVGHFRQLLQNQTLTRFEAFQIMGPFIIRAPPGSDYSQNTVRTVQESVAKVLIDGYDQVFADIHELEQAKMLPVIRKATVCADVYSGERYVLEAARGLIVNVVREDSMSWCLVVTDKGRPGLIHKSMLKDISTGGSVESDSATSSMLNSLRENCPESIPFFESMIKELNFLSRYRSREAANFSYSPEGKFFIYDDK